MKTESTIWGPALAGPGPPRGGAHSHRMRASDQQGYTMAALLTMMAVMAIFWSMALPVWRHEAQREKEAELVFRGEQYARAIGLFQRKFANASPPSIDVLIEQKFLRKKYKDPMVPDGEFRLVYQGQAQVPGSPTGTGRPGEVAGQPGTQQQQTQPSTPGAFGTGSTFGRGGTTPGSTFGGATGTIGGSVGGPIMGVASKSTAESIRLYKGRGKYNEWEFLAIQATQQAGAPGGPQPGQRPGQQPGQQTPGSPFPGGRGGLGQPGVNPGGPGTFGPRPMTPPTQPRPR